MVVMLSSIGVPGLNGFVGEYLILIGSFLHGPLVDGRRRGRRDPRRALPAVGLPAGVPRRARRGQPVVRRAHAAARAPCCSAFIGLIVFIGVYPKPLLDRIEPSVDRLIDHVEERTGVDVARARTSSRWRSRSDEGRRVMSVLAQATFAGSRRRLVRPVAAARARRRGAVPARSSARSRRRGRAGCTPSSRPAAAGAAGVLAMVLWDDITDDGPTSTLVGGALAFDTFALFVTITICAGRRRSSRWSSRRLPPPRGRRRARGLRPVPRRRHRRRS